MVSKAADRYYHGVSPVIERITMRFPAAATPAGALAIALALAGCAVVPPADQATLARQVTETEQAFADTMARRDFAAFQGFLAEETVFYSSGPVPLRGKGAVAGFWKRFFDGEKAPFSWAPDRVDVLESGTLAHSSGPVRDPQGNLIARFNSVWRQEAPGQWKIVFDKGETVCDCAGKAAQ
jgi:ketosteroid isomerase-like protein